MPRLFLPSHPHARAFFYQAGTTTPQDPEKLEIFVADTTNLGEFKAQETAMVNPAEADANGLFDAIFLDDRFNYKVAIYDAGTDDPPLGAPIFTVDNLQPLGSESTVYSLLDMAGTTTFADADLGVNALIEADASGGSPITVSLPAATGVNFSISRSGWRLACTRA